MKSREITDYMDLEAWPPNPYGLKAVDIYELATACKERATDPERERALTRCAVEAAGAAYAAGFDAGLRKAKNDRRRAKQKRRENEPAEKEKKEYGLYLRYEDMNAEQAEDLLDYLKDSGIRFTVTGKGRAIQ